MTQLIVTHLISAVVGGFLGYFYATWVSRKTREGHRGAIDLTVVVYVALAVALVLIGAGTIRNQNSLNEVLDSRRDTQVCMENLTTDLVAALDQRTSLTSRTARADRAQNEAFLKIATLSLRTKNPPTLAESRAAVKDYETKLRHWLDLLEKQANRRDDNPYPTTADYRECIG